MAAPRYAYTFETACGPCKVQLRYEPDIEPAVVWTALLELPDGQGKWFSIVLEHGPHDPKRLRCEDTVRAFAKELIASGCSCGPVRTLDLL
jgi:hypothetical protein